MRNTLTPSSFFGATYKKRGKPRVRLRFLRLASLVLFFFLAANLFLAPFFLNRNAPESAYAYAVTVETKGGYARVITDDTPFYSDVGGSRLLFYLPYTYYVKVLNDGDLYSHVECYGTSGTAALDGYVPSDMLFYDGLSVKNPYVDIKLTAVDGAVLYSDASLSSTAQYVFSGRTMTYYGALPLSNGSFAYFVGYNDRLGYVKESDVMPFTIVNHPNELTFIKKEEPEPDTPSADDAESDETDANGAFDLRVLIIASLAFAGITALFVAFRRKPDKRTAASYYDENDYE